MFCCHYRDLFWLKILKIMSIQYCKMSLIYVRLFLNSNGLSQTMLATKE